MERPSGTWWRMRPSASNRRGRRSPRSGSIKLEADTKVALDERLVSFSDMALTESNFPSLSKEQTREIVAEIVKAIPADERVIGARPRAGHRRQEPDPPEERRGREGRSAGDLLQPDAGRARQYRRRSDLEPDQGERPEVRGQHELGPLPARADQDVLPAARRLLAHDEGPEGHVGARPGSCPRASPSCRPTRTGRRRRPPCPARSWPPTRCRRCS